MTFNEFLKRFASHLSLAMFFWLLAALAAEHLLPGFITPFINLPGAALLVFVFLIAAIILS